MTPSELRRWSDDESPSAICTCDPVTALRLHNTAQDPPESGGQNATTWTNSENILRKAIYSSELYREPQVSPTQLEIAHF
jgi:hypothetical protein